MLKFGILMPLLAATALSTIGCGGANVVKVKAAKIDATMKANVATGRAAAKCK